MLNAAWTHAALPKLKAMNKVPRDILPGTIVEVPPVRPGQPCVTHLITQYEEGAPTDEPLYDLVDKYPGVIDSIAQRVYWFKRGLDSWYSRNFESKAKVIGMGSELGETG